MVTAEDDDDSDNDCLYIDESPTANQGSTKQPQDAASNSISNELTNPEVPIDYLPLMKNVEILKNIPYIEDVLKPTSKQKTAKIACRDFSRKPFGTNDILNSALYQHLTTGNTMPPNQQQTGTSNGLTGTQNLKNVFDAPRRPLSNPYAPLPTTIAASRPVLLQNETFMTENYPRTQPNQNVYVENDLRSKPNTNVYIHYHPGGQPNTNVYDQSDLRNQPNMNVYAQNGHQMDGNQMPKAQASPNLPNKTSVLVRRPGNFAGGTMIYRQSNDKRLANNMPITNNGYPVQNGYPAPANQEAQIRQMYAETRTENYEQTTMTYQGVRRSRHYKTCALTCPCRRGGVKSHSPLNPVPDRGTVSMTPLNNYQPMNLILNHNATNRGALGLNPGHELWNSSSSPLHQSMNSTFNPHVTNQVVPALNPGQELMIPSLNPQHQQIDPTFNPDVTSHGVQSLNPGHELWNSSSMNSTFNPQVLINMSPSTLQHQTINSPLNLQLQSSSQPQCYSCAMGKPCVINPGSSYFNVEPTDPMQNSQTGAWNGYRQNYNRHGSIPQNPDYSSEQIRKEVHLAALRSYRTIQNATRDIPGPPIPVNKEPRAPAKQRAKPVKKTENPNASLAAICSEPMNNRASASTLPCCTPAQSYTLPNWAAFGTQNAAPRKLTPKTTKVSNVKKTQDINIEIPHIYLTTDVTQKSNTNMTTKVVSAPLSIETHKQTVNERIEMTQTNVTRTAHNMNAISLLQDSFNVEGQLKPMIMNVNNNGTPTYLMEAPTQQDTPSNDINQSQINTGLHWIDVKSDVANIPQIMDQEVLSMENNVETTIQPSVIEATTKTVTYVQSETSQQQPSDNIDIETAMALLHTDTDETPTNATENSKTLAKSTNAYELVSTTSFKTETSAHNTDGNDIIMRTDTSNSEVHTNRELNINQIIENTVTVSIVKKIVTNPNISLPKTETLLDILNKVHGAKEANNIGENIEQARTEHKKKVKTTDTAVDDGSQKGIEEDDHQTKDVPDSKNDDKLKIARQNLAQWSAIEHDNKNKCADYNTKTNTANIYHVEVTTDPHGVHVAQVKILSSDVSSVQQEEFNMNCPIGKITQIKSADSSEYNILPKLEIKIENDQGIKEPTDDSEDEEIKNIKNKESELAIDELIFFKFQIYFFRLVQERLSENNQEIYAQKLHNAIHDLIILSDYEDATADLKYECHECHNVTIYSPHELYYNGKSYLKSLINSSYNCQFCLTFKRKYIEVLIKYIKLETSGANLNTSSKQITENTEINEQKPDTTTDLINEHQIYSKPAVTINESDKTNKNNKDCNVKEQRGVITADPPSSTKQVEIKDQKKHINKNTPCHQTSFVVKLPRHMLKESTVEALIQCKSSKSNNNKSGGSKNLNIVSHDNCGQGTMINKGNILNNLEGKSGKETLTTVTNTATAHGNENITSLDNDKNKENHYSKRKTINTNKQKNTNTKNCFTNIENNNNQERCANKRKSISAGNEPSSNPDPQNIHSNSSSNNNDANLESQSKKKESISDKTNPKLLINPAVLSKNMDESDKNHERQSKKRKSLSEFVATTIPNTNTTSDKIDDQNKNQHQHSERRKSICIKTATITTQDAQNSKTTSDNDDDTNHERPSKKRKNTSVEVVPSRNQNRNSNISEKNDKDHEGHSKRRKSISAGSETRANPNDSHNNCKKKERNRKASKNICRQLTTPEDKDTTTKHNEEHETRQPNASKNISDETATSKNDESQKRKTITTSNNDSSNSNKQSCNPEKNHAANNKKDNNEVRKSIDSETTTNKDTGRLNVQDNASNKNIDNEKNIARTCEAKKTTTTTKDILSKKQTTTVSHSTSTETTTNNHTENQQSIILKFFRARVEWFTRKNNNGDKRHNSVNTDNEKASEKSAEKLHSKEKDELPRVEIPGKKENKCKNDEKVKKYIAKITDKYICSHCYVRYNSFPAFEKHLADNHKIVKIEPKDYTKMITCPFCPADMKEKIFNKHVEKRHPEKYLQAINNGRN